MIILLCLCAAAFLASSVVFAVAERRGAASRAGHLAGLRKLAAESDARTAQLEARLAALDAPAQSVCGCDTCATAALAQDVLAQAGALGRVIVCDVPEVPFRPRGFATIRWGRA